MSDKTLTAMLSGFFIAMLVLAVLLGVFAGSFWAGVLAFIGVLCCLFSLSILAVETWSSTAFFILATLGILALAGASILAGLKPLWLIISLWAFSSLTMAFSSEYSFKRSKILGYVTVLLALLAPGISLALFSSFSGIAGLQVFRSTLLVWCLLVGGLAVLVIALAQASAYHKGNYFTCVILGLVALGTAAWLSRLEGGWWWVLPWLIAAVLIGFGAHALPKWRTKSGRVGMVIAVLCGLAAVGLPLLGSLPGSPSNPVTEPVQPVVPLSALDVASTNLAIAQADATRTYVEEQEKKSQPTPQSQSIATQAYLQTRMAAATQQMLAKTQTYLAEQDRTAQSIQAALASATQAYLAEQAGSAQSTPQSPAAATQAYLQTRMAGATQQVLAKTRTQGAQLTLPTPTPTLKEKVTQAVPAAEAGKPQGPTFLVALGNFVRSALRSVWGIVYLLIFFGLGQLWIRKWGGWLFLGLLLLLVGLLGAGDQPRAALFNQVIATGPATWWQLLLSASQKLFGSPGWVILVVGALVPLLELPGIRINRQYGQRSVQAQARKEQAALPNKRESLAIWINLIIAFAMPISLWVALHRLSLVSGTAQPFLLIPDLAVPHWKPVWHIAYFVIGLLFMISYNLALRAQSKQRSATPWEKLSLWGSIPIAILATLLVPCGVLFLLTAQNLSLMLFASLLNRGLEQAGKSRPAPVIWPEPQPEPEPGPKPRPQPEPKPDPRPKPQPKPDIKPQPEPPSEKPFQGGGETVGRGETVTPGQGPSSRLAGETLCELSSPIIGGYLKDSTRLCLLDEKGRLTWLQGKHLGSPTALSITSPLHLLTAQEGKLVVVSGSGQVQSINAAGELQIAPLIKLQSGIEQCALNPFSTLLAYVPRDRSTTLHGYFLAAQNDQLFIDLGEDLIACLAFSQNGRFIGLGSDGGGLKVVDIATRQVCLDVPDQGYGTLTQLGSLRDEQWVAMYADGWVACWDMQGVQKGQLEMAHYGTSLAVDSASSRILVGDDQGYLWAYPLDLRTQEYGAQVQDGVVEHIFPAQDGSVITISDALIVRRTRIS